MLESLKRRAKEFKREVAALSLACGHPRTPLPAKVVAACVVAYALSPLDLIPDFIPVLGYVDDLILVPAGIALAVRLIPEEVMAESRAKAERSERPGSWLGAAAVVALWLLAGWGLWRTIRPLF